MSRFGPPVPAGDPAVGVDEVDAVVEAVEDPFLQIITHASCVDLPQCSSLGEASIIAIHRTGGPADTFDAMTSTRAYRKALPVSGGNPFPP